MFFFYFREKEILYLNSMNGYPDGQKQMNFSSLSISINIYIFSTNKLKKKVKYL